MSSHNTPAPGSLAHSLDTASTHNTGHTPGPWHLSAYSVVPPSYVGVFDAKGNWHAIAEVRGQPSDAHLIAAAPELLEALEMALSSIVTAKELEEIPAESFTETKRVLRAAIAKATGGDL